MRPSKLSVRVYGERFDSDAFYRAIEIESATVIRAGEPRFPDRDETLGPSPTYPSSMWRLESTHDGTTAGLAERLRSLLDRLPARFGDEVENREAQSDVFIGVLVSN